MQKRRGTPVDGVPYFITELLQIRPGDCVRIAYRVVL